MTARNSPAAHKPGQLTLCNKLPPAHPQRLAIERAVRSAFAGLAGNWNVVVELSGGLSLLIVVLAPDHSAWFISCCNPEHWNPESIGGTVRAACMRRGLLNPVGATAGSNKAGAKVAGAPADSTPARALGSMAPRRPNREAAHVKPDTTTSGAPGTRSRKILGGRRR